MTLTDEQIDRLEGRELDVEIALALGHEASHGSNWCKIEGYGSCELPRYHRDATVELLLEFREEIHIKLYKDGVNILAQMPGAFKVIATGLHEDMATILCRAYLKLKGR